MGKKKQGIPKEDYIKLYNRGKLEEAFKIALDTRKFEIELYWKRTGYFVLFIGAVFVGYYTIINTTDYTIINTTKEGISKYQKEWLLLLLSALGFLLSLLWYMANRGSKFWQENWEAQIEELSTHLGVPIFGIIKRREHSIRNLMQEYPFSVSKVNQMVSLIITFTWLLMLCKEIGVFKLLENIPFSDWYKVLAGGIVIMLSFLIIMCCKGFAAKESRKGDKLERREWRKGIVWVSGLIVICRDKIITLIKNLFTKSTESEKEVSDYFWNYSTDINSATSQTSNKITKEDPMQTENKQR
ncbi:RipA family octameric membrane protein [Alloprevotella tannerae]|uniref:RipA family octameric membrane protein n=1 Tax=Alloprevotella tannerae TaxID=76122 RepID=UPI00288B23EC|nr:hypothetical protein [Alloprevotella tannerae]